MLRETGLPKDSMASNFYISDQLFQTKVEREEAEKNVLSVQGALRAYMTQEVVGIETAGSDSRGAPLGLAPGSQATVPQFGDSALKRLMEISAMTDDSDYRQLLTNRVIAEGLVVARLERQQAHYEEVLRHLQYAQAQSGAANPDIEVLRIQSGLEEAFAAVARVVEHMNAIYEELSVKNLNPAILLYSVSSPFTQSTERSVPARDRALYGLLILVMSLIIVPVGCLGHSYFQREIVHQETDEQRVVRRQIDVDQIEISAEELAKRAASRDATVEG